MSHKQLATLCFAILMVGWYLSSLCIHRHWNLASREDLAMFDQMLWNLREGRDLMLSISGGRPLQFKHHFFGEHFSPVLWLIAAPAGLSSGPEALLVIQAFAFAFAAIPAALLASARLGSGTAGLTAGLLWLAMPGMWQGVLYDFHMEAFEALFLFSFFHALLTNKPLMWLWALLYLSCKEDTGIYLGLLAPIGGWMAGKPAKGVAVSVLAFTYMALTISWIMPHYSPTGELLMASRLPQPGAWAEWLDVAARVFVHEHKWKAFLLHLVPFTFLPILGGRLIIPAAACVALMWLSTENRQALLQLHYPLTLYPLLFISALGGAVWLAKQHLRSNYRVVTLYILLVLGLVGGWNIHRKNFRPDLKAGQCSVTEQHTAARSLLRSIPNEGSLSAPLSLSPQLSRREDLRLLLRLTVDSDWLVLPLTTRHIHPFKRGKYDEFLHSILATNSPYGVWDGIQGEVVILKRNWPTCRNTEFQPAR